MQPAPTASQDHLTLGLAQRNCRPLSLAYNYAGWRDMRRHDPWVAGQVAPKSCGPAAAKPYRLKKVCKNCVFFRAR